MPPGPAGDPLPRCDLTDAARPLDPLLPMRLPRESLGSRIFTGIGTTLDAAVVRAMQIVVERALIPDAARVGALRESAQALLSEPLQAEPSRFFGFLADPPHEIRIERRLLRPIEGGAAHACRITSDYRPHLARSPAADAEQSVAAEALPTPIHVELWQHEARASRGTLVALHGFTMGRPRIDAIALMARQWYARGLDVALVTLPYHGARTPPQARFSGEHFAVPDVSRLSEAVREAVYEIRQVLHWRRQETGAPVGLLGLSLGGYLTALAAGLLDEIDFAIPIVPPVCIGDLAWRFFETTRHHREGGASALSQEELRRAFRVHSPLAHPLRIPRERVLIVAGRGDRIVPPEHPAALWRHWQQPPIHWFSGSHLAPFGRPGVVRAIVRHLRRLDVL